MCQPLEDCLVSRIGFRVFLSVISTILVAVIIINVHYVAFRQPPAIEDARSNSGIGPGGAVSSAVVNDLGHHTGHISEPIPHNRTKILIWTDDDGPFFAQLSKQIVYLRTTRGGCPSLYQCAFSNDKRKLPRADAVIVAAKNVTSLTRLPVVGPATSMYDLNSKIWTLLLQDPSYHSVFSEVVGDTKKFDYLVSYLPNSTFPLMEIKFESKTKDSSFSLGPTKSTLLGVSAEKRDVRSHKHQWKHHKHLPKDRKHDHSRVSNPHTRNKRETDSSNRRLVATIMDVCDTPGNRENYIEEMRKSDLEVQVYGKCGVPCPGHSKSDCLKHIDNHYKFYLSFDSHICQHYLSEDLWQLLGSTTNLVPVVFGGVNYVEVLPHDAYIDALNQSPASLAQTLLYLSKNEEAFKAYLAWRSRYTLSVREWPCYLCEALTAKLKSKTPTGETPIQLASEGLCTSWPQLNFADYHHEK